MLIAQDEKARLRGTVSEEDDHGSVKLDHESIPRQALERSPVLDCALESRGEATLPVKPSAFRLWLCHHAGRDESLEDSCTILKVATFLQDDTTIADTSRRIAHAFRSAFREDTSSHRELFAVATRRPADLKTDCFFPNFHDAFPRHPGPHLAAVMPPLTTLDIPELALIADHLCLYETLPGPVALRAAALTCHLLDGCLDLFDAFDASSPSMPLHYTVAALAPALALGTAPPIDALRVPSWALRRSECLAPLLPHLSQLRRLVVVGADGGLHSSRLGRFLALRAAAGHPGLETLDFCTCRCSVVSPHRALADKPPKGPPAAHTSLLRGYLCISQRPPANIGDDEPAAPQAVPATLTALRSINLSVASIHVAATLQTLPLAELTCLRVCVSAVGHHRGKSRRDAAAAMAALTQALGRTSQLHTLNLDLCLEHDVDVARPGLQALVAVIATCTTLRSLTLRPRWPLPHPFHWLLPLSALTGLRHLASPPCFDLLQKLPLVSAVEFTSALDDVTAPMMRTLLDLRHLRTLALVNELTFDTYDVERSAHSEALDELQGSCAVIGSSLDVWSRSVEGFRRRGNVCHCWDPCGHRAQAAAPRPGPYRPSAVTMVVRGDTEERGGVDPTPAGEQTPAHRAAAVRPAHSAAGAVAAAATAAEAGSAPPDGPPALTTAIGMWPELAFLRGLRHVRLLVREPTNAHRDLRFWRAVAALPHLEHLEVVGLPGEPGLAGFIDALAGHSTLHTLVLHGKEGHAHALLQTGAALKLLPALREVCLDADVCDMSALRSGEFSPGHGGDGVPEREWELEGVRHALSVLCERWKAALSIVVLQQPKIVRLQARVRCTDLARF